MISHLFLSYDSEDKNKYLDSYLLVYAYGHLKHSKTEKNKTVAIGL